MGTKSFSTLDDKDPANLVLRSGDDALRRGDVSSAIQAYSQAVGQNNKSVDGYLRLAELAIEQGRFTDALQEISKAERVDKANWKNAWYKGRLLEAQGNYRAAKDQYSLLVEDVPGELPPLLAMARVETKLGQVSEALGLYNLVLRAEPSNNEAAFGASAALLSQNNFNEAATALQKVNDNSSRYIDAQLAICSIYLDKKDNLDEQDLKAVSEALRQLKLRNVDSADYLLMEAKFYRRIWELSTKHTQQLSIALPFQNSNEAANHPRRKIGSLAEESYRAYIKRNPTIDVQTRERLVREKFKVAPWRLF